MPLSRSVRANDFMKYVLDAELLPLAFWYIICLVSAKP